MRSFHARRDAALAFMAALSQEVCSVTVDLQKVVDDEVLGPPGLLLSGKHEPDHQPFATSILLDKSGLPQPAAMSHTVAFQIAAYRRIIVISADDSERRLNKFDDCVHVAPLDRCINLDLAHKHRNATTIYDTIRRVATTAAVTVGTGVVLSNILRGLFQSTGPGSTPSNPGPRTGDVTEAECKRCAEIFRVYNFKENYQLSYKCRKALFRSDGACSDELDRVLRDPEGGPSCEECSNKMMSSPYGENGIDEVCKEKLFHSGKCEAEKIKACIDQDERHATEAFGSWCPIPALIGTQEAWKNNPNNPCYGTYDDNC